MNYCTTTSNNPDSKVHGANMGPTWVLSAPDDGPHAGPMNLANREYLNGSHWFNSLNSMYVSSDSNYMN